MVSIVYTGVYGTGVIGMIFYMKDEKARSKCGVAGASIVSVAMGILTAIYSSSDQAVEAFPPAPLLAWPIAFLKIWTFIVFVWKARG